MEMLCHRETCRHRQKKKVKIQPNRTEPTKPRQTEKPIGRGHLQTRAGRGSPAPTTFWYGSERGGGGGWRPGGCWEHNNPPTKHKRPVPSSWPAHGRGSCHQRAVVLQRHVLKYKQSPVSPLLSRPPSPPSSPWQTASSLHQVSSSADTCLFSFWGRFSHRRSSVPAGRAPRPSLGQHVP